MRLVLAVALLAPASAWADDPFAPSDRATPAPEAPSPAATEPAPSEPAPAETTPAPAPAPMAVDLARAIDDVTDVTVATAKKQRRTDHVVKALQDEMKTQRWLNRFITVFVDVGAFSVGGDGSGIRTDVGHVYFPQYAGRIAGQWVFMGDPLSTAINSLGEPSDTSTSREIPVDTVNSEGRPSVLVNAIGLSIAKDVRPNVSITALAQFLPRPDDNLLDLQLAEIDYRPSSEVNFEIQAGKIDSVLGIEYRAQDAPRRLGVTPSLICRYTCGRPLGIRARLVRGPLSTSATLTNGNNFQRIFEPDRELKSNLLPTASGHVQWMLPFGQGLEVGISGAVGPQDNQPDLSVMQWHYGLDWKLTDFEGFDISAEYVQGLQQGRTESMTACDAAPCLTYKGAYVLVDRRVASWFTPYVRVDWRDAVHTNGTEFVYESHTMRATIGGHFEMTSRIVAKLEYTFNRELGAIPQFPNDIVTSSIVVATD